MNKLEFEGHIIKVTSSATDNRLLFDLEDITKAVGYKTTRSIYHHIVGTKKLIKLYSNFMECNYEYMDAKGLRWLAKRAYKTPGVKRFADWASKQVVTPVEYPKCSVTIKRYPIDQNKPVIVERNNTDKVFLWPTANELMGNNPKPDYINSYNPNLIEKISNKILYGIKEAASILGLPTSEFTDWLVEEGFAERYTSNNNLHWVGQFKDSKMGINPVLDDFTGRTRISNVPKLTQDGIDYLKEQLKDKHKQGVLSFAVDESTKLEAELDSLIKTLFIEDIDKARYTRLFDEDRQYQIGEKSLLKKIKSIITLVKIKEIND